MASSLFSRALFSYHSLRSPLPLFFKPPFPPRFYHKIPSGLQTWESSLSRSVRRRHLVFCTFSSAKIGANSYSTQAMSTNEPVVSAEWLHANLKKPDIKVLDASWYMPDEQRNPIQEYQVAHIPGALFFDVDGISDRTTNMLFDLSYSAFVHPGIIEPRPCR